MGSNPGSWNQVPVHGIKLRLMAKVVLYLLNNISMSVVGVRVSSSNLKEVDIFGNDELGFRFVFAVLDVHVQPSLLQQHQQQNHHLVVVVVVVVAVAGAAAAAAAEVAVIEAASGAAASDAATSDAAVVVFTPK